MRVTWGGWLWPSPTKMMILKSRPMRPQCIVMSPLSLSLEMLEACISNTNDKCHRNLVDQKEPSILYRTVLHYSGVAQYLYRGRLSSPALPLGASDENMVHAASLYFCEIIL